MRKRTQKGSHRKSRGLVVSLGKPLDSHRDARPSTPDCGAVSIRFSGFKVPGTGPTHGKLWLFYLSRLPQRLEQYLVNEWMSDEGMNNNKWMNERVAELMEGLTHTLAI